MACFCCTKPAANVALETQRRFTGRSKCGYTQFGEEVPVPIVYRTLTYHQDRPDLDEGSCELTVTLGRNPSGACTQSSKSEVPTDCADMMNLATMEQFCYDSPTSLNCADGFETASLSEEDTVEDLEAETVAALAAAAWGSGSSASRNLVDDETTLELAGLRCRVRHKPSPTCYLKVWLRATTTTVLGNDEETGEVITATTTEDLEPYEWIGEDSPCFGGKASADEFLYTDWIEIPPPAEDGITTVSIVKISLLPDFTPIDGNLTGLPPEE